MQASASTAVVSPFLTGFYAPVRIEREDSDLVVSGSLPRELNGTLFRNGPNPQFDPGPKHHWFDGDGMVHAITLEDGRARYRNRYVRTERWARENAAGRALFSLAEAGDPRLAGCDTGVANTSLVWHAGRLMALEEAHDPVELERDSLRTLGRRDLGSPAGKVTAHPKIDPLTGELIYFAYNAGATSLSSTLAFGVVGQDGMPGASYRFEAPYCSMMHDFAVTPRFAVFPVLPLSADASENRCGAGAYLWRPERGAHLGLLRRDAPNTGVQWFDMESCYAFHVINAWEAGDQLHMDVMEYPRPPMFPDTQGQWAGDVAAYPTRWTIELKARTRMVRRERLSGGAGEFPRIDERRSGLQHRHSWYVGESEEGRPDRLVHIDGATGRDGFWRAQAGLRISEPVFVPQAADAEEGAGWLTAILHAGANAPAKLAVFNATDLEAGPLATVDLRNPIPMGFHGCWRPAPDS